MFEVFSGTNRPNTNKWPGAKFGKISLNYLDLWHLCPPYFYGLRENMTFPCEGKFTSSHCLPQKVFG